MLKHCDVPTDPKSVPFLDIAKYRPVLTDLMATTPTLTDRISIRPEEGKKGTEIWFRKGEVSPSKTTIPLLITKPGLHMLKGCFFFSPRTGKQRTHYNRPV